MRFTGGGTQTRACACPAPQGNGATCVGDATQTCNTQSCGTDGGWCDFGTCSATCGGGVQSRVCACPAQSGTGADCVGSSWQFCNTQDCPPVRVWYISSSIVTHNISNKLTTTTTNTGTCRWRLVRVHRMQRNLRWRHENSYLRMPCASRWWK